MQLGLLEAGVLEEVVARVAQVIEYVDG